MWKFMTDKRISCQKIGKYEHWTTVMATEINSLFNMDIIIIVFVYVNVNSARVDCW